MKFSLSKLQTRIHAGFGFLVGLLALVQIDLLFSTGVAAKKDISSQPPQDQIADTLIVTQSGRKISNTNEVPPPSPEQVLAEISKDEALKLRRDFQKKLLKEIRELKERHKRELKDASRDRKKRRKEWDESEKQARRKFFEENLHGPERRKYMHDLIDRRKSFYKALKNEESALKADQKAKRLELEGLHKRRRQEFDSALSRNLRPPQSVWGE